MSWIKLGIFWGLLIWTALASAGEIDRSTDSQGTIHITTPKPIKTADKTAIKPPDRSAEPAITPPEKSDEPVHLDYRSRPRSRRPMNTVSTPGSSRGIRPSPYLNTTAESALETPNPEEANKGSAR
jgi:hypothetical protein